MNNLMGFERLSGIHQSEKLVLISVTQREAAPLIES